MSMLFQRVTGAVLAKLLGRVQRPSDAVKKRLLRDDQGQIKTGCDRTRKPEGWAVSRFALFAGLMVMILAMLTSVAVAQVDRSLVFRTHPVDGWNGHWLWVDEGTGATSPHGMTSQFFSYNETNGIGSPGSCDYLTGSNRLHNAIDFRTTERNHLINSPVDGEIIYYRRPSDEDTYNSNMNTLIVIHGTDGLLYLLAHTRCTVCGTPARGQEDAYTPPIELNSRRIRAGEEIGRILPKAGGYNPHLHFGVIDPRLWGGRTVTPLITADNRLGSSFHGARWSYLSYTDISSARYDASYNLGFIDPATLFGGIPTTCASPPNPHDPPTNDNLANAQLLPAMDFQAYSNIHATREPNEPPLLLSTAHGSSVWFHYGQGIPEREYLSLDSNFEAVVAVFASNSTPLLTSFANLRPVASALSQRVPGERQLLRFRAELDYDPSPSPTQATTSYFVVVAGRDGRVGDFRLLRGVPRNCLEFPDSASSSVAGPTSCTTPSSTDLSAPGSSTFGQTVSFTATTAGSGGTPTGNVTFHRDGTEFGTAPLVNGRAVFTTATLPVGTHRITAVYGGGGQFAGSTSSARTIVVSPAATALTPTVTNLQAPSQTTVGEINPYIVTVSSSSGVPGGTVVFRRNGSEFDWRTLDSRGVAIASVAAPSAGNYQITAAYLGSGSHAASNSATRTLVVQSAGAAGPINDNFANRIVLTGRSTYYGNNTGATRESGEPLLLGDTRHSNSVWWSFTPRSSGTITVTTVNSDFDTILAAYEGTALNNLRMLQENDDIEPGNLQSRITIQVRAGVPIALVVAGYKRVADSAPAAGNIVLNVTGNVDFNVPTLTAFVVSPSGSSEAGQTMTLGALVWSTMGRPSSVPTGFVSFRRNGVEFERVRPDASGFAWSFPSGFPVGTHQLSAVYLGDSPFLASSSATVSHSINRLMHATSTALTGPSTGRERELIRYTARVTATSGTPRGTVVFRRNGVEFQRGTLDSGGETSVSMTQPPGNHTIRADYLGSADYSTSASPQLALTVSQEPRTTTTEMAGPSDADRGQTVTFSGRVIASGATPNGTVVLYQNGQLLDSGSVDSAGRFSFSTSFTEHGAFELLTHYLGSEGFRQSISEPSSIYVSSPQRNTTTALSGPATGSVGEVLTFQATVTATEDVPTGTVIFRRGETEFANTTLNGEGVAEATIDSLSVGTHQITAQYIGDQNHRASVSPALSLVIRGITATSLDGPRSVNWPDCATFEATVTSDGGNPSGNVSFRFNGRELVEVALNASGVAVLEEVGMSVGVREVQAVYLGNTDFTGSSSDVLRTTVTAATTVELTAPATANYGEDVVFTATVRSPAGTVRGRVSFRQNGIEFASGELPVNGLVTVTTSDLPVGSLQISAHYSGSAGFLPSATIPVSLSIDRAPTATTFSGPSASVFGESVTFSTAVEAAASTPTGTVTFQRGSATIGTVALSGGGASITTSTLGIGTDPVSVSYGGSATHAASTSSSHLHTVSEASVSIDLSVPEGFVRPGASARLVADVSAEAPSGGTPSGSVRFSANGITVGTTTLRSGRATLSTALPQGDNSVLAHYVGSHTYNAGESDTRNVVVSAAMGAEIIVNQRTRHEQRRPAISSLGRAAVVVFEDQLVANGHFGITAQRVNWEGQPNGDPIEVGPPAEGTGFPHVAQMAGGSFVVVWEAQDNGVRQDIFMRRFRANGRDIDGVPKLVNASGQGNHTAPRVAALEDGGYAVVWQSDRADGDGDGIVMRLFEATGDPRTDEILVNRTRAGDQRTPDIAVQQGGDIVVSWAGPTVEGFGAYAQRVSVQGTLMGAEIEVGEAGSTFMPQVRIAAIDNGNFAVTYDSSELLNQPDPYLVIVQRLRQRGPLWGDAVPMSRVLAGDQRTPAIAGLRRMSMVAAWRAPDGGLNGVWVQMVGRDGRTSGAPEMANTTIPGNQFDPAVGRVGTTRNYFVVWTASGTAPGDGTNIVIRRYMGP